VTGCSQSAYQKGKVRLESGRRGEFGGVLVVLSLAGGADEKNLVFVAVITCQLREQIATYALCCRDSNYQRVSFLIDSSTIRVMIPVKVSRTPNVDLSVPKEFPDFTPNTSRLRRPG
jgi:hypothetical protein